MFSLVSESSFTQGCYGGMPPALDFFLGGLHKLDAFTDAIFLLPLFWGSPNLLNLMLSTFAFQDINPEGYTYDEINYKRKP